MTEPSEMVNVRYMVDDVDAAIDFYTKHLDFEVRHSVAPAFADVTRGNLRLLLSGPTSSAGRPMPDGAKPGPGGWNRIHLLVDDIDAEVARLRDAGAELPQRHRHGPRRLPDPARGPLRQRRRAVPTRWDLRRSSLAGVLEGSRGRGRGQRIVSTAAASWRNVRTSNTRSQYGA